MIEGLDDRGYAIMLKARMEEAHSMLSYHFIPYHQNKALDLTTLEHLKAFLVYLPFILSFW